MKVEFFKTDFLNILRYQIHKNLCSGNQVFPCRQMYGCTDMTKLIVILCDIVNAPKEWLISVLNSKLTWT